MSEEKKSMKKKSKIKQVKAINKMRITKKHLLNALEALGVKGSRNSTNRELGGLISAIVSDERLYSKSRSSSGSSGVNMLKKIPVFAQDMLYDKFLIEDIANFRGKPTYFVVLMMPNQVRGATVMYDIIEYFSYSKDAAKEFFNKRKTKKRNGDIPRNFEYLLVEAQPGIIDEGIINEKILDRS
jgi:hypothetical protein